MSGVAQSFVCQCGMTSGYIEAGEVKSTPCPVCGRRHKGVYNKKTYQIDAVVIGPKIEEPEEVPQR